MLWHPRFEGWLAQHDGIYDAVEEDARPPAGAGALSGGAWAYAAQYGNAPASRRPSRWAVTEHPWGQQRVAREPGALRYVVVHVRRGEIRGGDGSHGAGECRAPDGAGGVARGEHWRAATRRALEEQHRRAWDAARRELAAEHAAGARRAAAARREAAGARGAQSTDALLQEGLDGARPRKAGANRR